jgi:hypothetical protein
VLTQVLTNLFSFRTLVICSTDWSEINTVSADVTHPEQARQSARVILAGCKIGSGSIESSSSITRTAVVVLEGGAGAAFDLLTWIGFIHASEGDIKSAAGSLM